MDYIKFCCNENQLSSLSDEEIKNPISVLENIYRRRPPEAFKQDIWEFFWSIFRNQLWKKKGGTYLYGICTDLLQLIDVLWLINKYHPDLETTVNDDHHPTQGSKLMCNFNLVFKRTNCQNKKENSQKNKLDEFYNSHNLATLKIDIYNYLQMGLDASYMNNNKYDYFGLHQTNLVTTFLDLEYLITEGHLICSSSNIPTENPVYKKHFQFAMDADHTTTLDYESIVNPRSYIASLYDYQLSFEQLAESLKIWEKSFYEKNFWLHAKSPGNMLFFSKCLESIIDCHWMLMVTGEINIHTPGRKLTNGKKNLYQTLAEQELKQPFLVLDSFFKHKKMHEWKAQLNEWTNISLSYTEIIKQEDIGKTSANLHHLLRFIEASHLLTC